MVVFELYFIFDFYCKFYAGGVIGDNGYGGDADDDDDDDADADDDDHGDDD